MGAVDYVTLLSAVADKGRTLPTRGSVCVVGARFACYVKENTLVLEGRCTKVLG